MGKPPAAFGFLDQGQLPVSSHPEVEGERPKWTLSVILAHVRVGILI
jgi:hypothetical protein